MVILSTLGLFLNWPTQVFGAFRADFGSDTLGLLWIVALYAAIHIPVDYIGGYWLPCHFSRQCLMFSFFASQYIRGLLVQAILLVASGLLLLQVGRIGGRPAVLGFLFLIMLVMIEVQDWLARFLAGLRISGSESINDRKIVMVSGMDAGFAGGLVGLPGRERHIVPSHWQQVLPRELLDLEVERRSGALKTGSRLRGLALAICFNLTGFYISSLLPSAGVTTLTELFTTALGFTCWSFLGLLVLPTLSRRGVFELDHFAKSNGMSDTNFALIARELDQLQDDEPTRNSGIETIFHPIPNVESRIARFRDGLHSTGAWNAARYALYLSWPCLGFLNRAVHCNSGRPELWVMLPID